MLVINFKHCPLFIWKIFYHSWRVLLDFYSNFKMNPSCILIWWTLENANKYLIIIIKIISITWIIIRDEIENKRMNKLRIFCLLNVILVLIFDMLCKVTLSMEPKLELAQENGLYEIYHLECFLIGNTGNENCLLWKIQQYYA